MYAFEVMSEVNLSEEELQSAKAQFMAIFEKCLADPQVSVRVAALKAITAFFNGITD